MRNLTSSHVLRNWVIKVARFMRAQDKDLILPISGDVGDGKSTLALILMFLFDPTFDADALERRIAWDSTTHMQLVNQGPRWGSFLLDEGEGILAQDHMTTENRRFKKFLYRCRKQNKVQIIITPNWEAFSRVLKDWRAKYRIETEGQGRGRMYKRGNDGHWGKANSWTFEFPSLEGTDLWRAYLELADLAAKGQDPRTQQDQDTDPGDEPSEIEAAIRKYIPKIEPLAQMARQEAQTDEGEPWTNANE